MNLSQLFRRAMAFRGPIIRAVIFGAAWYLLPAWLFVIIALYLYFVPFFQSIKFFPFFVAIFVIYWLAPTTIGYALVGAILFGWILAIKELLFIDRRSAYEIAIIAAVFFLVRLFYRAQMSIGGFSLLMALLMALMIGWIIKSLIERLSSPSVGQVEKGEATQEMIRTTSWLSVLLVWQALIVVLLLPVDFVYQSVFAFLLIVPIIDLATSHLTQTVSRQKLLFTTSVIFAALVLILTSAPLGL